MNDENNQVLNILQESFQRERKQMKALITITLCVLAIVTVAFLVVGALWIKSLSRQNEDLQKLVVTPSGATSPTVEATTPVVAESAPIAPPVKKEASVAESAPIAPSVKKETPSDVSPKVAAADKPVETEAPSEEPAQSDSRDLIKRNPANEVVTLKLPAQAEPSEKIPGYTGSRLTLVTERGVPIPWLIVVPEGQQ